MHTGRRVFFVLTQKKKKKKKRKKKKVTRNADFLFLLICGKGLFSIDLKSDFEHDRNSKFFKNSLFLFLFSVSPVTNGLTFFYYYVMVIDMKSSHVWLN